MPEPAPQAPSALFGVLSSSAFSRESTRLAERLRLALLKVSDIQTASPEQFFLNYTEQGLGIDFPASAKIKPVLVDFVSGAANHRRLYGGGKGQLIAKAIGLKSGFKPQVLDLTAGMGQDAFVLACLGCQMQLTERVPVVYELLADGLARLNKTEDQSLRDIGRRLTLHNTTAQNYLNNLNDKLDVIYFDPMFPAREKSAKVKKAMQIFHQLVGIDDDAGDVLAMALDKAKYRVVVKRPRIAPALHEQYPKHSLPEPALVLVGKSSRFDVYTLAKMP